MFSDEEIHQYLNLVAYCQISNTPNEKRHRKPRISIVTLLVYVLISVLLGMTHVNVLLAVELPTPEPTLECEGSFKGVRPTEDELMQILAAHQIWLNHLWFNTSDIGGRQANLCGIDLADPFLRGNSWLKNANLGSANLQEAYLHGINLEKAQLQRASLYKARLSNANLYNAFLTFANLQEAVLTNANLTATDLGGTNLQDADLTHAYLERSSLLDANLQGATLSIDVQKKIREP